ncbi:MAG: cytochrome c3 family protein [Chloroflexota bacterium]
MIKSFFEWLKQPLGLVAVGIGFLVLFSLAAYGIYTTQQPPAQPIQFPHKTHVAFGIQCLYCHPTAERGPSAGLPATAKCWACHQQIQKTLDSQQANTKFPLLRPLVESVRNGDAVNWVPVAQVPEFVQYNHRPHIAAGFNCEDCHGDVSQMTIYENPQVMNMGWCLNCHKEQTVDNPELRTKLLDCGTCHY